MFVGVIKFSIHMPLSCTLKDKRSVVRSLCHKIRNRFDVSVAEVDRNDDLRTAIIGISCVSNDSKIIQSIISHILTYIQQAAGSFVLQDFHQEILSGF